MSSKYDHEFVRTTGVQIFKNPMSKEIPPGYPTFQPEDDYTTTCFEESYEKRKNAFIDFALRSPATDSTKGFFYELIRMKENKGPINENAIYGALEYIDTRKDCSDFMMTGILRLYYQFRDHQLVTPELREACKKTILEFKYWPDELGVDSMCYWTENHHMIFSTCELLAGQLFPDEIFTNSGHSGKEKVIRATKRVNKWMELRFYTGFSEWLSNVYFDESMPPLINLFDLAEDKEIQRNAKNIIDLMLYDMALNSYYGLFTCTHGRTYTLEKTEPLREDTIDTAKMMFGIGKFTNKSNMSTVLFALSEYVIPEVIVKVANSTETLENRQRVSIKFKDAKKWGYGALTTESAMGLLSFGGYSHHRTFNYLALMLEKFDWWDNKFFLELQPFKKLIRFGRHIGLTNLVAFIMRKDMSRNSMTEANLYTYRTKDYMLSTAQDYLKSSGGDQHHIWQATLDNQAIVFTTHPGGYGGSAPDGYWHGNGFMPKSVQHKNVNVTIYKTPKIPVVVLARILEFTHVFFPRDRYEKIVEENGWVFGKSNNGYVALKSMNPYIWVTDGEWKDKEIIADGRNNIYVTEMGSLKTHGSFDDFVSSIAASEISFNGLNVEYSSPVSGKISTGWKKKLKVNNQIIETKDYKRYENNTSVIDFESDVIEIEYDNNSLRIEK